jgi:uncharacterized YigZ family protein
LPDSKGIKPYKTIGGAGESEIVISKSRFLGYCIPISSEAEAQERIAEIRKKHWDARHVCYAFRLVGGTTRSADDGEPSGTAGSPILNVLAQGEIENTLCVVVRYFGGVLLGKGGLVRAYGRTASEALENAGVVGVEVCAQIRIMLSYAAYALLEPLLKARGRLTETEFAEDVKLTCIVPCKAKESFLHAVTERTGGRAEARTERYLLCALENSGPQPECTDGKQGANGL